MRHQNNRFRLAAVGGKKYFLASRNDFTLLGS
jgi:hypothetical protein